MQYPRLDSLPNALVWCLDLPIGNMWLFKRRDPWPIDLFA